MIAKLLMKNPVLIIGIIFMGLFLNSLRTKGYFTRDGLIPTSCKAALIKLNKSSPKNWTNQCNHNEMLIKVDLDTSNLKNKENLKKFIYHQLANHLVFIAKNSPQDSLERVGKIFIFEKADNIEIQAMTKGEFIVKFSTLKDRVNILKHLQNTVTVKEVKL